MPNLDTTNLILIVLAVSAAGQFLLLLAAAVWLARQAADVRRTLTRLETQYAPVLARYLDDAVAELRGIAARVDRAGNAVERTARGAQAIVDLVGHEVERTTRGVRSMTQAVSAGYARLRAWGGGVRARLERAADHIRIEG